MTKAKDLANESGPVRAISPTLTVCFVAVIAADTAMVLFDKLDALFGIGIAFAFILLMIVVDVLAPMYIPDETGRERTDEAVGTTD